MQYSTQELVTLLREARRLLHKTLMGQENTKEWHDTLLDFHDRTWSFGTTDSTKVNVQPLSAHHQKVTIKKVVEHKETKAISRNTFALEPKPKPLPHLSIDAEANRLRANGVKGSREELRAKIREQRRLLAD